ncbi:stage III sporulation protein AA [Clostridium cavendishii DSM 21758]|uniref:Stage III sporulation protein AA n=1 Tax=Clostridium cavendishii DSM 21758 TaxID=1121302 RepID=A0A1M6KLH5_9CLOT|nr:stage III sporulation protein AA [Clostridium cavendishii]SHJ59764.1 stage III sporulation protein AA [Clostridium cavendishii DSM 21758]
MNEIIKILSKPIADEMKSRYNFDGVQEIRIKINRPLILIKNNSEIISDYVVTTEDVKIIMQRMSGYSIYAFEEELKQGYITINGGHRVGIAGQCVIENNQIKTIKAISSLNIRICREIIGCSNVLIREIINKNKGELYNTVIVSPPKCGKTTMLRDIVRNISNGIGNIDFKGRKVALIDERSEIAASFNGIPQMNLGIRTDVYDNCIKSQGMMMAIRSMGPEVIVCDEIGTDKDVEALLMAYNCGVNIITTLHGADINDIYNRPVFNKLLENRVIKKVVVLSNLNGVGTIEKVHTL